MKSSRRQTHSSLNLPEGRRFVVAFSGGIDSLALVLMMKKEERKRSAAVYVDHSLRPREELDEEISLNIRNARALSIPFYIIRLGEGSVSLLAKEKDIAMKHWNASALKMDMTSSLLPITLTISQKPF